MVPLALLNGITNSTIGRTLSDIGIPLVPLVKPHYYTTRYIMSNDIFLAHLSRRLRGELIVYQSSRRPSVRPCVRLFTLSNMNISETNGLIATKFYQKHHWSGGLTA